MDYTDFDKVVLPSGQSWKLSGITHCLSSLWPGFNSQPRRSISKDFSLADRILPTRPEPAWQKMAQSPLNDTTQPVDSEEEGQSPTMDRWWLKVVSLSPSDSVRSGYKGPLYSISTMARFYFAPADWYRIVTQVTKLEMIRPLLVINMPLNHLIWVFHFKLGISCLEALHSGKIWISQVYR